MEKGPQPAVNYKTVYLPGLQPKKPKPAPVLPSAELQALRRKHPSICFESLARMFPRHHWNARRHCERCGEDQS